MQDAEGREVLKVEDNALIEVPIFEERRGARNWLAIISHDPNAPNGLTRRFVERGRGRYHYKDICVSLLPGQPIEFGADHGGGEGEDRSRWRWYGTILEVSGETVTIQPHGTAAQAINHAHEITGTGKHKQAHRSRLEIALECTVTPDQLEKAIIMLMVVLNDYDKTVERPGISVKYGQAEKE